MSARVGNNQGIRGNAVTTASPAVNIFMRLAAVTLLVVVAISYSAAQAPDCVPGKLTDYEKLGTQGCMIGDERFSDFHYHRAADGLPDDAISLTPGTVPDSDDSGLLMEAAWVAPSSQGSSVSYTVDVRPNGKAISGASLELQFGQIAGTGVAKVVAKVCPATAGPAGCSAEELKLKVALGPSHAKKVMDSGDLTSPARQLHVTNPLCIATGKNGSASLNGFMTVFHSGTKTSFVPGENPATSAQGAATTSMAEGPSTTN